MKVLLVGINFWPEAVGCAKYTTGLAEYLCRRGHDVRVITAAPYYPQWKRYAGWPRFLYKSDVLTSPGPDAGYRDVPVVYCPHFVPSFPTGLKRILHLASFGVSALPVALLRAFWRPHVVVSIAPTLFSSLGALLCARLSRATAVLHIQDFELDAAFELDLFRRAWLRRLALRVEAFVLRRFDIVSTISPAMLDNLLQKGVSRERAVLFPNGVDTDAIFPQERPSSFRDELGIPPEKFIALYSGTMSVKQGLETVLDMARMEAMQHIEFILCGEGPARSALVAIAQGMPNVRFLPLQPAERLNQLLNLADIHLLPQRAGVDDLVLPSKLTGMLASGRPVLAWAKEGTAIAAAIQNCGAAIPPGDIAALAAELNRLSTNDVERLQCGLTARKKAVEELGVSEFHRSYEEVLENGTAS